MKYNRCISSIGWVVCLSSLVTAVSDWPSPSIETSELSLALNDWEKDYAVFLFAPWCKYCREFKPIWHEVYKWFDTRKIPDIEVVMFNCEENAESEQLCSIVGLQHYPSVLFVGHGSFYPNNLISFFSNETLPEKTIMYKGELYYESVLDWCRTMQVMSKISRYSDRVRHLFGWTSPSMNDKQYEKSTIGYERLKKENIKLKEETLNIKKAHQSIKDANAAYAAVSQTYGTDLDVFEVLSRDEYGIDHYPNSHSTTKPINSVDNVLALRECMAEVVSQYCEKRGEFAEPYCTVFNSCLNQSFVPHACRPATCPLHKPGCNFASICLNNEILNQFFNNDDDSNSTTTHSTTHSTSHSSSSSNATNRDSSTEEKSRPNANQARAEARREALANFGK